METQFVTDKSGNKVAVILPIKDYEQMVEDLEDVQDVKLYDKAKKEDDGQRIPLDQYLEKRTRKNG